MVIIFVSFPQVLVSPSGHKIQPFLNWDVFLTYKRGHPVSIQVFVKKVYLSVIDLQIA
jgi:hypothetical protein